MPALRRDRAFEDEACKRHLGLLAEAKSHKELMKPVESKVVAGPVLKPGLSTRAEIIKDNRQGDV